MKNSFRLLLLIILGVWVSFTLYNNKEYRDIVVTNAKRVPTATPVKIIQASLHSLETNISIAGKVEGTNEVFVVASAAGEVERILVEPGSKVRKGQLLATLNSYYMQQQYELAKSAHDQNLRDYRRLQEMAELKAVTGQQLEQYALKVAASETQMNLAERRLGDASIKATVEGTVNQLFTSEGALLAPGRPFCEIIGGPFNVIRTGIDQRYLSYLQVGMRVTLRDFQRIYATSARIAAIGIKPNQLGSVPLEIAFDPIGELYAGRIVDATINISLDSAIYLPKEAVLSQGDVNMVLVAESNHANSRKLIVGEQIDGFYRVIEGLSGGESIIVEGNHVVKQGDPIRVIPE